MPCGDPRKSPIHSFNGVIISSTKDCILQSSFVFLFRLILIYIFVLSLVSCYLFFLLFFLFILVLCLTLRHFVLVFFSPFSIAITSLGEERANLSAFRTFV